jgi:hypothetical protein
MHEENAKLVDNVAMSLEILVDISDNVAQMIVHNNQNLFFASISFVNAIILNKCCIACAKDFQNQNNVILHILRGDLFVKTFTKIIANICNIYIEDHNF